MNNRDHRPRPSASFVTRLARRTTLAETARALAGQPVTGIAAWARTTSGIVWLLVFTQLLTGVLLAFHYVPSTAHAHATVAFIDKTLATGAWVRALHFHGSQWLALALVLHLARMFWDGSYVRKPVGWTACIALLALTLAGGATGFSLPWDARAFFSTRVLASVAGGVPIVGDWSRRWILGGAEITTLTVSRLYALHILVLPALVIAVTVARLFVFRDESGTLNDSSTPANRDATRRASYLPQLTRHAIVIGVVFLALSICATKFPAPLGPPADAAPPGYLPRPGAQFLWLFQLLKYSPGGAVASLVALLVPTLLLGGLALLPLFASRIPRDPMARHRPIAGIALFASGFLLIGGLTALAYFDDARNPRVRDQLARQAAAEANFRRAPFEPLSPTSDTPDALARAASSAPAPEAFTQNCAKCHGARGEGKSINPSLIGIAAQPRRTVEDIVAILNDPASYQLESRMPSFADKLTDDEKQAIALWITSLKK